MTDSIPSRNDDDAELFRDLYFREQQSKLEAQDKAGAVSSTEPMRYELHKARAMYEKAVEHLTRIYCLLNPPKVEAQGKVWEFNNPNANATLQALSDAIRAIPEEMRSDPPSATAPLQQAWRMTKGRSLDWARQASRHEPGSPDFIEYDAKRREAEVIAEELQNMAATDGSAAKE